jgi:hypothetical protein
MGNTDMSENILVAPTGAMGTNPEMASGYSIKSGMPYFPLILGTTTIGLLLLLLLFVR